MRDDSIVTSSHRHIVTSSMEAELVPLPIQEGPSPPLSIALSPEFTTALSYFRALLRSGEVSSRALGITERVIEHNSANYAAWEWRRRCLTRTDKEDAKEDKEDKGGREEGERAKGRLEEELSGFARRAALRTPKNYQLWHHRRSVLHALLEDLSDGWIGRSMSPKERGEVCGRELSFVEEMLAMESKNYHAWSHRQWLVRFVLSQSASHIPFVVGREKVSEEERLEALLFNEHQFIDRLLTRDVRNNSAWNHRYTCLEHKRRCTQQRNNDSAHADTNTFVYELDGEISWAIEHLKKAPYNESAWNFLAALARDPLSSSSSFSLIKHQAQTYSESQNNMHASSTLLELLLLKPSKAHLIEAFNLCETLANRIDPIRRLYWLYRQKSCVEREGVKQPIIRVHEYPT